MARYSISAPDGNTYEIDGPDGATQEQVQAEVLRQTPTAGQATTPSAPAQTFWERLTSGAAIGGLGQSGVVAGAAKDKAAQHQAAYEELGPKYVQPPPGLDDSMIPINRATKIAKEEGRLAGIAELSKDVLLGGGAPLARASRTRPTGAAPRPTATVPRPPAAPRSDVPYQTDLFPGQAELPLRTPQRPPAQSAAAPSQQLELSLGRAPYSPGGTRPRRGTQMELPLTVKPQHAPYPEVPGQGFTQQNLPPSRGVSNVQQGELFSYEIRPPKPGPVEDVVRAETVTGKRPSMWRRALTGLKSTDYQEFKLRAKAKLGQVWTPEDVARGNPAAEGIVRDAYAAHDIQRILTYDIEEKLSPLYRSVQTNPESVVRIHRALDGQPISLSPSETTTAVGLRKLFDDMADMAGLPREQRLSDYFPHLRDEVSSILKVQIRTGGKHPVAREIPQEYKVFFQKTRTVPGTEGVEFGLPAVQRYVQAMAKRVSLKGGTLPDGSQVEGLLNRVKGKFDQLPEVNEYRAYFRDYIKDLVGGQAKDQLMSPQAASIIKKVEFLRTIGYNVTSPIHNLTQTLNTFAKTDPRSWTAAWYDIFKNKKVMDLARRHLDIQTSKTDIEILANPHKLDQKLDTIISGKGRAGWMFAKAEETNRLHAFAAGYRDAVRQGLTGDAAVDYAKRIVDTTQFRFGPENAPGVLRPSGGGKFTEIAGVVGQYKKFQVNQMVFLKNLLLHDPVGLGKWLAGTVAIGGTELPGIKQIKDVVTETLGGDPNDVKFRGLLGESGIYLGNQIGIGALPFENIRDIAFAFPGPALSHILEVASVVSNKALGITDMASGRFGDELSPDDWGSRMVRLGSVQANRIRQALVSFRSQGANIQAPRSQSEAFGLTPPTGRALRPKPAMGPLGVVGQAIGLRSPAAHEYGEAQQTVAEKTQRWNNLTQKFNEARAAGDHETMQDLRDQAQDEFGRTLHGSKAGAKGARHRQRTPGLERQLEAAPKQIRRDLKKEVQ